jgi:hypothetical protein
VSRGAATVPKNSLRSFAVNKIKAGTEARHTGFRLLATCPEFGEGLIYDISHGLNGGRLVSFGGLQLELHHKEHKDSSLVSPF